LATQTLNVTFDGVNDVPRLPGQGVVEWYNAGRDTIDRYSVWVPLPDDLDATLNLTGSNWRVRDMQVAGEDHITRIRDLDDGSNRRIEQLNLGYNSDVDLISTEARTIIGWRQEGNVPSPTRHDINLGDKINYMRTVELGADTNVVNTAANFIGYINIYEGRGLINVTGGVGHLGGDDLNDRFVVEDGGRVSYASTGQSGNDKVTVRDGGRIGLLEAYGGNNNIAIVDNGSRIDTIRGGNGDVTLSMKNDSRSGLLNLDNGNHSVTLNGSSLISSATIGDGDQTITLNDSARIVMMDLYGDGDKTLTLNDDARINSLIGGSGDYNVTLNQNARIQVIQVNDGVNFTLNQENGWINSIGGWQVNSDMTLGRGVGSINFDTDQAQTHKIKTLNGAYIEQLSLTDNRLNENDNQSAELDIGWYAGSIQLGNGADVVKFADEESSATALSTSGGDDMVSLGTYGAGAVFLSRGDDTVKVKKLADEPIQGVEFGHTYLRGGSGEDTIDFTDFGEAVTFTLAGGSVEQFISGNDRAFIQTAFENLTGTGAGDTLTGDGKKNVLDGAKGKDKLVGGGGDDMLIGGGSNDRLIGGNGKDIMDGGTGKDTLEGGKGNDTQTGGGGEDVFIFGKNAGADRITDWTDGVDILRIKSHDGGFAGLTISDQNANLRIEHDNGTILLLGEAGTVLTAADFDFV
jgi:Ca2+-binding RTX toxin-like protein